MKLTKEVKEKLDAMTIRDLLYIYRFAPIGDLLFEGDSAIYFKSLLQKLRDADPVGYTKASKSIGWSNK